MGLGKTLQGIALMHTLYTHEFLGLTKFVVLAPLNVCENWIIEVEKWTGDLSQPINTWNLHSVTDVHERLGMWFKIVHLKFFFFSVIYSTYYGKTFFGQNFFLKIL